MMLNGAFMAKIRSKTVVVCDAGPLIHLDEVGHLQLLADFKEEVADALQRIRDVSTLYIKNSLLQEVITKVKQEQR